MRVLGLLLLFITAVSCEGVTDSGLVSREPASGDSVPSKWKGGINAFPLSVELGDSFDDDEIGAIDNASESWSDSVDNAVEFFDTQNIRPNKQYSNVNSYQDSVMGIYKLTDWPSSLSGTALAVTQLFGYRKNAGDSDEYVEIHHADILVNYDNFTFKTSQMEFGYDLETVILHEMGHFIGLYHDTSSIDQSVMYPSISRYDVNRVPKVKDIQKIKSKYSIGMITPQSKGSSDFSEESNTQPSPSEEVSLVLELNADGHCRHYLNGELVYEH